MKEKIIPLPEEKEEAARRITSLLEMSELPDDAADILREVLNEYVPGIEEAYASRFSSMDLAVPLLTNEELPRFLVDMMGVELFEGDAGRILRRHILENLLKRRPSLLKNLVTSPAWDDYKSGDKKFDEILAKKAFQELTDSKRTKWFPGGMFARKFISELGFPTIFEGISSEPSPKRIEEAIPRVPYNPLTNFQKNMKNQIMQIFSLNSAVRRAIVSLPTGAGKTKIVAEAIVQFWKFRENTGTGKKRFVLWIAQTEELCEQAVSCFKQIWEETGTPGNTLNIFRAWGGRGLPYSDEEGIIVAGIDQLHSIAKKTQPDDEEIVSDLKRLCDNNILGGVFIDEAHRSWAPKYRTVLKGLDISTTSSQNDRIPLIGLTATPERTAEGETEKLLSMYGEKRIYPNSEFTPDTDDAGEKFDSTWSNLDEMKRKLTEQGFLSKATYHYEDPRKYFEMTKEETETFEQTNKFDPNFIRKIGTDSIRNNATYGVLKKWVDAESRQVLFFGTNIHQALLMSRFLEDDGIRSATITGNTRYGARKAHVKMFREKEIQVLCNYEVLTTGFDVPRVDTIIIARPTNSRIVYQQMVGRGLRGPRFHGTETCDIITIEDKIQNYEHTQIQLGYMEYKKDQVVDI